MDERMNGLMRMEMMDELDSLVLCSSQQPLGKYRGMDGRVAENRGPQDGYVNGSMDRMAEWIDDHGGDG